MSNVFQNIQLERIAEAMQGGGSSVTVNIDVTGAGDMHGATASAAGAHGLVPAPAAGDEGKVLSGAGTWIDAGSVGELGDLEDVTITSPTSGESLKYDGSKWVNGNVTAELPDFIEETSGSIVTVEAAERPAKSLVVAINPVQSGSGDPSPENVRPISGWTECNVVVSPTQDDEDGTTYAIEFKDGDNPLTVYGGTLDVVNGTLTVTMADVDLGTLTWNRTTSYSAPVLYANVAEKLKSNISMLCSIYKFIGNFGGAGSFANASENASIGNCNSNAQIFVMDDSYSDPNTFKTAMNGVQLVYELATPQTYQLTPTEVQMLLGTNNIWADTGEITELKYIPQTYDDLIKEVSGGELGDLEDVTITSPTSGESLKYDGTKWVNGNVTVGAAVVTRQIVNTGETWDGNAVMCCVIDASGMANGSGTNFQLETFGVTPPAIQGVRRIELLHHVNGYWANCSGVFWDNSSKYFRGNLSSPLNGSGTLYIFFYFY